jgi:hypothetical protein
LGFSGIMGGNCWYFNLLVFASSKEAGLLWWGGEGVGKVITCWGCVSRLSTKLALAPTGTQIMFGDAHKSKLLI